MEKSLYEDLKTAVRSGNHHRLEELAYEIGSMVLEDGSFPRDAFDAILTALQENEFRDLAGSWKLLRVFEENWEDLSEQQRTELLPALEHAYPFFKDWMACFVISGILGELYQDDRAFATLSRLATCPEDMPRSFIPHGFEHLAKESSDEHLAKRAFAALTSMGRDSAAAVRAEVEESLGRLKKVD